jgi:hypothetical protein
MKNIEITIMTTQRIAETFFAVVEDDDPLTKETALSLRFDIDKIFKDSRFRLAETGDPEYIFFDVKSVNVEDRTIEQEIEERR